MLNLEEKLKNLPDKPGVYIMKNEDNHIIYVGKAINLKNRVRQYFQASRNQHPKVTAMVENIRDFEYIITDSELEALILECNLIKKHRPRYNVMLKDDKHYPYIKVTLNESFPRVLKVREIKKDKAKYFGPYTDGKAVNQTIELISKIFPIRSCSKNIEKISGKERPCLNAHINRCIAPCSGKVSKEEYGEIVKSILLFLEGKQHDLVLGLQEKMEKYAEALDFEKAAELRDQIDSVKKIGEKQIIISSNLEDQDIIAYAESGEIVCIQTFFVRGGKLIGRETFFLSDLGNSDGSEIISSFLKQFYNKALYIPKTILVSDEFEEKSIIEEWLGEKRGTKVSI
ncbi:MAG: excinuclease ABC subunit UvrC, partial [Lutispora sp.]